MAKLISAEPEPCADRDRPVPKLSYSGIHPLPKHVDRMTAQFEDVLTARRSKIGKAVNDARLGSLLWHATQLRERCFDGRFGQWESRPAPSAGGLHPVRLLVLPVDGTGRPGLYADDRHALCFCGADPEKALALNADSLKAITGAATGTTLQLVADITRIASCYSNYETLLWRDAGALTMTICLVAEALNMTALPLGRVGTDIVEAFGLNEATVALGAVHIGERDSQSHETGR